MQICSCSMTLTVVCYCFCVVDGFTNCFGYLFRRNMRKLCDLEILIYGKLCLTCFVNAFPIVTLLLSRSSLAL